MFRAAMLGAIAALVVAAPMQLSRWLRDVFPDFSLSAPLFILGVALIALGLQRVVLDRRPRLRDYNGLADFFLHIHELGAVDRAIRWFVRGANSLLLSFFGGVVGPEGAAAEIAQASGVETRDRSASLSEQRRRVDAASALSGGIAAAFGSPFAAVMVPIELGLGGPVVKPVAAALAAYLVAGWIGAHSEILAMLETARRALETAQLGWVGWSGVLAVSLAFSSLGFAVFKLRPRLRRMVTRAFAGRTWLRIPVAGVLLALLAWNFPAAHQHSWEVMGQLLSGEHQGGGLALLLLVQTAMLAVVLAGFGSVGVFWPLFAIGTTFGVVMNEWVFRGLPDFMLLAGIAGAGAAWGAVLGAPFAVAVLVFELTQSASALAVALASALLAKAAFKFMSVPGMISDDLRERGMTLVDGRSHAVLDAIPVREAMVADFETVHEHEPVSELHLRMLKSRYPFIPVVNAQGNFRGILTVDMIEEAWQSQQYGAKKEASRDVMMKLLEAKDLLYRAGLRHSTVGLADRLSAVSGKFDETPCVAVISEDGRVAGLLFVHHVRMAYDRELARRALMAGTDAGIDKNEVGSTP